MSRGRVPQLSQTSSVTAAARARVCVGDTWFDDVTMAEALARIEALVRARRPAYVVTPNVDHVVRCRRDPEYADIVRAADLVLVDGGAGQVSAAKEILDDLGLDVDLAGLAKRNEEVWLPGKSEPVVLAKDSPALRVLVAVRDETHRFATGLSRKLRMTDATFRVLQEVPGIGDARAKSILRELGSLDAVAQAEPGYIGSIARVNEDTARKVIGAARRRIDIDEGLEAED